MKRATAICAFAAMASFGLRANAEPEPNKPVVVERFQGTARAEDGSLAYRESHEVTYEAGRPVRALTRYFDAAGKTIAELRSDYRVDAYAPSYVFLDGSGRTLEAASLTSRGVRLQHARESKVIARTGGERERMEVTIRYRYPESGASNRTRELAKNSVATTSAQ
jgi:hypothetical protein